VRHFVVIELDLVRDVTVVDVRFRIRASGRVAARIPLARRITRVAS
jgi:hypothetical protein